MLLACTLVAPWRGACVKGLRMPFNSLRKDDPFNSLRKDIEEAMSLDESTRLPVLGPSDVGYKFVIGDYEFEWNGKTWWYKPIAEKPDAPTGAPTGDMVNHPKHYRGPEIAVREGIDEYGQGGTWARTVVERGGKLFIQLECLDVMRHIQEPRLATAFKYIWRVGLAGGKFDDDEDIKKAIFYLNDFLEHKVDE